VVKSIAFNSPRWMSGGEGGLGSDRERRTAGFALNRSLQANGFFLPIRLLVVTPNRTLI
jgi:hypothetical protein